MSLLSSNARRAVLRTAPRSRSLVVDSPAAEWAAKREAIKHHAHGTTDLWRKISVFGCLPAIAVCVAWVRNVEAEHAAHQEILKEENDGHLPHPPAYPSMNIRSKPFPWGPNSLFWNPHTNKDMSNVEAD